NYRYTILDHALADYRHLRSFPTRRSSDLDNGANQNWGGHPDKEGTANVTNNYVAGEPGSSSPGPNDPMVNNLDGFHFIGDISTSDRKSTRLNSSHVKISYAVFCLKKKK